MKKEVLIIILLCAVILLLLSCQIVEDESISDDEKVSSDLVIEDVDGLNDEEKTVSGDETIIGDVIVENAVTDVDGNTYKAVKLGNQVWMAENLRTTHYADGTSIALGGSTSTTTAYRYCPDNSSSNVNTYGYLYNWPAVMHNSSHSSNNPSGVQGICPNGWHVPSCAEWTQMEDYVSSHRQYVCGSDDKYVAKALAYTTGWNSSSKTCAVGDNPSTNNATGFSAVPAGYYSGSYMGFGNNAYFWFSTEIDNRNAQYRGLYYGNAYVDWGRKFEKSEGFSVRCVKD